MADYLIRNARVDGDIRDIAVTSGFVTAIGKNIPQASREVIDAGGGLTVPGLVDCHAHIDKSHLNERAAFVHGTGAVKGALTREEKAKFTVADITERAERVIRRAIRSGTLILRTNVDVDAIVGLKGIEALLALREKYRDQLTLQVVAFSQEGIFQDGESPALLDEALRMGADLIGGHTITCGEGERHIDFILDLACKYGVGADFHLDESGNRADYLLPYLAGQMRARGLCGRVNAIHMCTLAALDEQELQTALDLLVDCQMKASIAPTAISTRQIAPVKALLRAGIPTGIGSDNIRDFFNPLGCGDLKHIALLLSYLQAFYSAEDVAAMWDMMTAGGARVLDADYGIAVGKKANITVFPVATPVEVLSAQAQPALVMRAGKVLYHCPN